MGLVSLTGNPANLRTEGSVILRPRIAAGLPFSVVSKVFHVNFYEKNSYKKDTLKASRLQMEEVNYYLEMTYGLKN